ncbi:MAG TPA: ABC transporter substrate-binding protein [Rhizomicrobium sp.]|nr:ABC transporter substrate-binding protein [Rhizomicrobium sp.]
MVDRLWRLWPALSLALLVLVQGAPARAQQSDPAAATIQTFYDALVASMKSGGTAKSRYEKLKPAVDQAFDISGMTALAVGPTWSSIAPADQKALIEAFDRMTIANYARNFDSYSGEKFTVDPQVIERGSDKLVKTTLKPASGDAIPFNYRMRQVEGGWKIEDIYLNGNISQLAQKRSDFGATLQASGPEGLAKKINALADQTLG